MKHLDRALRIGVVDDGAGGLLRLAKLDDVRVAAACEQRGGASLVLVIGPEEIFHVRLPLWLPDAPFRCVPLTSGTSCIGCRRMRSNEGFAWVS